MPDAGLRLETVDATAPEATLRAIARHDEVLRAERMPEDPPLNEEATVADLRRQGNDSEGLHFLLWDGSTVVGNAAVRVPLDRNTHLAFIGLSVLPSYRRRGLSKRLMAEIVACAEQKGRSKLMTNASSLLPAGEAVLRHLGAKLALEQQFIQLDLGDLEPGLLTRWMAESEFDAPDYRLWQNQGSYPADRLGDIAEMHDVISTAPIGERDMQGWQTTPENLREQDEALTTGGKQRLTTFAEHKPSGKLAAFTELFWDLKRPTLLFQHATAVRPEHRRHSLGRWIKAANLLAAQAADPSARFVRAANASSQVGMLRINQALGFRAFALHTDWQIDTAALRAYLNGTAA